MYGGLLDHDDPRGFRKKRSILSRIQRHGWKLSWLIVIVLIVELYRSHRHRTLLFDQISTHKTSSDELRRQMLEKQRELQEMKRRSENFRIKAEQQQSDVKQWEDQHTLCKGDLMAKEIALQEKENAIEELKNQVNDEKTRREVAQASASRAQTELKAVQGELDKTKVELETLRAAIGASIPEKAKNKEKTNDQDDNADEISGKLGTDKTQKINSKTQRGRKRQEKLANENSDVQETISEEANEGAQDAKQASEDRRRNIGFARKRETSESIDQAAEDGESPPNESSKREWKSKPRRRGSITMLEEHLGLERGTET